MASRPRRVWRWILIGFVLLVVPGVVVTLQVVKGRRFRSAMDEYQERAPLPLSAATDDPSVRAVLQTMFRSIHDRLGGAFSGLFDLRRTLAEIESRGGDRLVSTRRDEEELSEELGAALGALCLQLQEKQWKGLVHSAVQLNPARGEAEAVCLVKLKDPREYAHLRFWLLKEETGWKIYDLEDLDNRARLSSILGRFAKSANPYATAQKTQESMDVLRNVQALLSEQKNDEALDLLQKTAPTTRGSVLEPGLCQIQANLLSKQDRKEEAIAVLDRLLQTRKGLPGALISKGNLVDLLGRKKDALPILEEAWSVVGPDPSVLVAIGRLRDELGDAGGAKKAYLEAAGLVREDPDLAIDLGYLLLRRSSWNEAEPLLLAAGTGSPDLFMRAGAQLKEARAGAALERLIAIEKAEEFAGEELPLFRGPLLRWKGRLEDSERILRAGLLRAPPENSPHYMEELSLTLAGLKRTEESLKLAKQLETATGWAPRARFLQACALVTADRAQALKLATSAIRERPSLVLAADYEPLLAPLRTDAGFQKLLDEHRPKVTLK
jgi:tetratricopeptide (TPR) repeat protein